MKLSRKEFLRKFGLGGTGFLLPVPFPKEALQPVVIYDNYVKGLMYYAYRNLQHELKSGEAVELKREPENRYDRFAVAVHFKGRKLGYLPAYENIALANLMDHGYGLQGIIAAHDPEEGYFYALSVAVSVELPKPPIPLIGKEAVQKRADDYYDLYRKGVLKADRESTSG